MERYGPATYGDHVADLYDDWYQDHLDTEAAVEWLAELAGDGAILELAVGTGRLALPLAGRGLDVHGIDTSQAMLQRLQAKPGGDRVHLVVADMAEVVVEGPYSVVFAAENALFLLSSQEKQLRCFTNVAARLSPDGVFVVEAFVPDPARYRNGQDVGVTRVTVDSVLLTAARHDPVRQQIDAQQIQLGPGVGFRLVPGVLRYAWPSELDLMARLAGLRLAGRWGGWRREPFTGTSTMHVSAYVSSECASDRAGIPRGRP
jgi:SAM-dependent methyltransferase